MSIFHHNSNVQVSAETMVALTEEGKRAIDRLMVFGTSYTILVALDEHSPRSMSNLSRETRLDIHIIQHQVSILKRQGMVRIMSHED